MGLLIYKASAGSGKTFNLAIEYIKHLIKNPRAYRQILAVTFTNKATTEMKERIMQQLNGIRLGDKNSENYTQRIVDDLQQMPDGKQWTIEKIREQAGIALHYMLHDYNRFRIETIDSFFQAVMRNLARELEQSPNLNIELNTKEVISEAVDRMMEKLTPTSPLLKWILDYIEERINNNQKWNTTRELKLFAENITNEQFIEQGAELRNELNDLKGMRQFIVELQNIEKEAYKEMEEYADRFFEILDKEQIEIKEFAYKESGGPGYFLKLKKGDLSHKIYGPRIQGCAEKVESWVSSNYRRREPILEVVDKQLKPLLNEAEQKRKECYGRVISCQKTLKNLHKLQLLNYINEEIGTLNNEKNRFLLSDTTSLLHSLIQKDDSSFIFEKLGTQLNNIMIDEFQDTSRMQWNNFRLLLLEGLSQGEQSLIVGDVKQSIYRWRNGDWRILNNLGRKNSKETSALNKFPIEVRTLNTNRRSEKKIIDFNNELFTQLVDLLNSKRMNNLGEKCEELINAYADVCQLSIPEKNKGYVKVIMPEKEEQMDKVILRSIRNEVEQLIEHGIKPEQMAILVRQNKHIAPIANYLYNKLGLTVVSDEAFRLDASLAINMLIDALCYLIDENDKIACYNLAYNYGIYVKKQPFAEEELRKNPIELLPDALKNTRKQLCFMPLYELLEELYRILQLNEIEKQEGYLFSFFDNVTEYLKKETSDISQFLQFWNETLCNKTIQGGEIKGIRAYTIHKSKGLQFHTVLIPYCDWGLENEKHTNLTWCKPQIAPYNKYSLLPIEYSSSMADSIYRKDYQNEQLQLWVDGLNMLYVALTRAEKNLLIWGVERQSNNIDYLICEALRYVQDKLGGSLTDDCYTYGKIYNEQANKKKKEEENVNRFNLTAEKISIEMESIQHRIDFKQSNDSAIFISGENENNSWRRFINRGNLMHYLFSKINTVTDVDIVIDKLVKNGTIEVEMENEVKELVNKALNVPEAKVWYDGSWKVINERDIIWMDEGNVKSKRPDRVMVKDNEVVIVDFKFGEPNNRYILQMKKYIEILTKMGYNSKHISGYLWYVDDGVVKKIKY